MQPWSADLSAIALAKVELLFGVLQCSLKIEEEAPHVNVNRSYPELGNRNFGRSYPELSGAIPSYPDLKKFFGCVSNCLLKPWMQAQLAL